MNRPRVVITHRIHSEVVALLSEQCEVVMNDGDEPWPAHILLAHARSAEGLMVFMPDSMDARLIDSCPHRKIVAAALKGFDNFDVAACTRRGIWFTIVPDLLSQATAELALALLLVLARNVLTGDARVRGGQFRGWRPTLYGKGLTGSTVGLIGYGAVGRAFERLISGFECRLIWTDIQGGRVSLDQLLQESDFVLPLLPLTSDTLHLINRNRLARMKPGAYLINVGRGSVVDEEAVADALESGRLAGYAADVFEMEDWARADRPRTISPRLLSLRDRTLFTPHLGSATQTARLAIEHSAAESILQALSGSRPHYAINSLDPLTT